jgi:nitroreductase
MVPRAAVDRALDAANWAPTHGKTEPWRFVVFEGESIQQFLTLKREGIQATVTGAEQAAALEKAAKKEKDARRCSHIIAICCKRVANSKGALMPEWEECAAVACAVQNMHLSLHSGGYAGYWSSGGVGGWADAPAVRAFLGVDGGCLGSRDLVMGFFHVGVAMPGKAESYGARRGRVDDKVRWVTSPPKE